MIAPSRDVIAPEWFKGGRDKDGSSLWRILIYCRWPKFTFLEGAPNGTGSHCESRDWSWETRLPDSPGNEVLATKRIMGRQQGNVNMADRDDRVSGYYAGFPSVSTVLRLSVVVTNRRNSVKIRTKIYRILGKHWLITRCTFLSPSVL